MVSMPSVRASIGRRDLDLLAVDQNFAAGARHGARQDAHQAGLAGAIVSEHADDLAGIKVDRHVLDGMHAAELLVDVLHFHKRSRIAHNGHPPSLAAQRLIAGRRRNRRQARPIRAGAPDPAAACFRLHVLGEAFRQVLADHRIRHGAARLSRSRDRPPRPSGVRDSSGPGLNRNRSACRRWRRHRCR